MQAFTYTGLPTRVIFGIGTLDKLTAEVERLGVSRALVLSTPRQREMVEDAARRLGALAAGIFSEAAMHTPVDVTERAMREVERCGADGIVAIGGGSTTGLGKAIALRTNLPQLVVPTTYAGSEMTPILGETEHGRKTTLRNPKVLPETVIYDVSLTLELPVKLSAVSGMNAIAHAVEALYAQDRNPVVDLMADEGLAALARALPGIVAKPDDLDARSDALYGAWLCGICLGSVGMALHHKLCHTLGGMFDLPHAETHAVILPHAMRYNTNAAPAAAAKVARALGAGDAARGLQDLARRVGAPVSLREIGMTAEGIEPAVAQAMSNPYWNPEPLVETRIRELLERAFHGSDA
ncbi:maleylacetate reductase [Allomesorhizobium camelthorni]|uniref:Maleylacetate reductase n=1 Tax=Allomesorhizobium camelthorni TaxID=475069 RepID=A0A6G4WDX8_9HYPH|nr:maleylacetate reductase [Mesorhizobium camelthorni]NGO52794.1 maleylacetate reductase [Mesorhizobium camelthorni]